MKKKTFDVWIRRDHHFSAKIKADSLEQALETAKQMSIEQLVDAPGETIDSEHKFTAVLEA
jgi:hypothetical protein